LMKVMLKNYWDILKEELNKSMFFDMI